MKIITHIIIFLCSLLPQHASALEAGRYAADSRLAAGMWVKVGVPRSGLYAITGRQLQSWGITDMSRVRVYGYGAAPISPVLAPDAYIDDLPQAPSAVDGDRLVFYGTGPESWSLSAGGAAVNNPNIYTDQGYYYITQCDEPRIELPRQCPAAGVADGRLLFHHEIDRVSVGEAGYDLVGESLTSQATRRITFDAPAGHAVMQCAVVNGSKVPSRMSFAVNGVPLPRVDSDMVRARGTSEFEHGAMSVTTHRFDFTGDKLVIDISVDRVAGLDECWLNYMSVAVMPDDGNAAADAQWAGGVPLPAPEFVANVPNQNLHAMAPAELVIFTPRAFAAQAQRLAQWHEQSARPLTTAVIDVEEAYNEFASGVPCPAALRRCLKMMHDRAAAGAGAAPRYVLLLGKPTYDHRHLTSQYDGNLDCPTIPMWMCGARAEQYNDNTAYGTDDITAMLADGSGGNLAYDRMDVAIGRVPVASAAEAKRVLDKIMEYADDTDGSTWRNTMLYVADDGDNGTHLLDTEQMIAAMEDAAPGRYLVNKVYVDAYPVTNGTCVGGRADMWRLLREGAFWWNYAGHANRYSWTSENMLTYNDVNNMRLRRIPVLMAATCNFMRWDSRTTSGAEVLMNERYGGTAATISATRPVYIADNARLAQAVGRALGTRLADGSMPTVGDVYRLAKNDVRDADGSPRGDTNRLRYALMGDPAMPMAMPGYVISLDSIDGVAAHPDSCAVLGARQRARLSCSVRTAGGDIVDDYDGTATFDMYDAEHSATTLGERDDNVRLTYEQHGSRLCSGSAKVRAGRFDALVTMPGEIADNFRPATFNMSASSTDGRLAAGVSRDLYAYGYDYTAGIDTVPPVIEALYLNHESWRSGDAVNYSPLVIARVSDNVAVNMSLAGIGHQMTITVDDDRSYADVSLYYTPDADGSPRGTIAYPLSDLAEGHHTIELRVWDTSSNSAAAQADMVVRGDMPPAIYRVYTDANPAVSEVNFYLTHNRPEADLKVKITVYNLMGREMWSGQTTGRSDMTRTAPVNWNLCDHNGHRVPRGIYVYRAEISEANGDTYSTASRKLAITGQ